MARKQATQDPAPPVKQKPVDPAPSAPVAEEAAEPLPVVEEPPAAAPEPEPAPEPGPEQAPEPVVPAADELPADPAEHELSPRAIELLAALFAPAPAPAEIEPLAVYAARIEEAAQPLPVCQITHPEAKDGAIHVGKYAGIRLVRGDVPAALLSDGSTI